MSNPASANVLNLKIESSFGYIVEQPRKQKRDLMITCKNLSIASTAWRKTGSELPGPQRAEPGIIDISIFPTNFS
jgi:hypothetical protein